MNKTLLIWLGIAGLLALRSFVRPSYAVGLYMLTYFAAPKFWWWGDLIEDYRWNFYAGLLLLLTVVTTYKKESIQGESPLSTKAVKFLMLWALNAIFVHLVFAVNQDSSFGWLLMRLKFILLFFLIQYSIRDEKDFRIIAMSITLAMGYIGYEATINERGSFSGGRLEGIGAAGVTSSNQLASLLITGLPISAAVLFLKAKNWAKASVLLCGGMTFNVVLMCNSRAAFLGVILGGVMFLATTTGPARKQSLRLAAVAAIGTFLLLGDPEIVQRFTTTFVAEEQMDNSASSRLVFWSAAGRMIRDYPLGSGGNSFSEGRGFRYMRGGASKDGTTRAIHNGFLTEMTDWGLQGFTFFMLFIAAVFAKLWQGRRAAMRAADTPSMMVCACLAGGVVAWLVSSFFGDYLNDEWGMWITAMPYAYLRVRGLAPGSTKSPTIEITPAPTALATPQRRSA